VSFLCHEERVLCEILGPPSDDWEVGLKTRNGLHNQRIHSYSHQTSHFLFSKTFRPALGPTQLHIQLLTWALSPEVKRPGRTADRSVAETCSKHSANIPAVPHSYLQCRAPTRDSPQTVSVNTQLP
jgi:hypothetical protein